MKIKMVLVDTSDIYLSKLITAFENKYPERFEIYSFTDINKAYNSMKNVNVDVFLVDELIAVDKAQLPSKCGFAYLVSDNGLTELNKEKTVAKFQKTENIYKQIISVVSDSTTKVSNKSALDDSKVKIISVVSVAGGVGSSCVAAGLAKRIANMQKRVLYLNLESFGDADMFFAGDGAATMSDVLYALKGKNTNVELKLESSIKTDISRVSYLSSCVRAIDMSEVNCDDIDRLVTTIKGMDNWDYLILDYHMNFSDRSMKLLNVSNSILMVTDGSAIANRKTIKALESIGIMEEMGRGDYISRMKIIYNRFSSKWSSELKVTNIEVVGGIGKYETESPVQLINQICTMSVLDKILV